jgi:phosphohistidine phosphatase
MKNIFIIRHAKADNANKTNTDIDRQLTENGIKDAEAIGQLFFDLGLTPDIIISSPAKRALMTAQHVAKKCKYNKEIQIEKDIYSGDADDILELIKKCDNKSNLIAIFGHSPILEILSNMLLTNSVLRIELHKASCLSIVCDIDNWTQAGPKNSTLEWLIYPKLLRKAPVD